MRKWNLPPLKKAEIVVNQVQFFLKTSKTLRKTMMKSVKTYPGKYREIWEEFREFPGKNIAIPAVNPIFKI